MDNHAYALLSRQTGLWREMQSVAENIANANTTGYRREAVVFSEFIRRGESGEESVSFSAARTRFADLQQAALTHTGDSFDMAIEGEGFFLVETQNGPRLTRAGTFSLNDQGELVTADGLRVLSEDGGALAVPGGSGSSPPTR